MLRTLWKWLAATFSVVVILLAIGIGLFRLLLPLIPQYHQRIEVFASEAAGTPVRIERIDARWGLDGPELRFHNAQLFTTDGREALLTAETGSVIIDIGTLISERQFRASRILLDGLRLEVQRDADGQWQIGGRTIEPGGNALPRRLAVGLRKAQIVFRDELTQAGPWIVDDVELNVALQEGHLSLDAKLKLPPELGGEIEASLQADGDIASLQTTQWRAYLSGADVDLSGWTALMPPDKTMPSSGKGDLVIWLAMAGDSLQQASVQFDLRQVVLAKNQETARLLDLAKGRIEFDRMDTGWQASGRDIRLRSGGLEWPNTTFGIEQVGVDGEDGLLYADVDFLRLEDIAPLADWIPDEKIRNWVIRSQPRGAVVDLSFRLIRELGAVDSYTVRSRFTELGMESIDRLPGFDNLSGNLRMDAFGGRLQLDPKNVTLDLPDIIGKPVSTKRMNGVIVWRHNAGGWRIVSDNIDLDHAAFSSSSSFELTLHSDKSAPTLDLRVNASDIDVVGVRDLIPVPLLKADFRGWLETAFTSGTVPVATLNWSGDLGKFPFDDDSGEFNVDAEFRDIDMVYAKNWPVARALNGTATFHNASFMIGLSAADLAGNRVSSGSVSMDDTRKGVIKIKASADGMLDSLHGYLKATPVIQNEDDPLARVDFSGFGTTDVDLTLPLKNMRDRNVVVTVSTQSGEVALRGLKHRLEQVEGSLTFRNGEFFGEGLTALVLNAPVVIDIAPATMNTDEGPMATTVATARGQVSDQELGLLHESLASMLQGSTTYSATATFPGKRTGMPVSIAIASALDGMAVTLPEPVAKPASVPTNLSLTVTLPAGSMQTDLTFGDLLNARVNWLRENDKPWVLERGGIHLGVEPARLPEVAGLFVSGSAERLNVGGWLSLIETKKSDQTAIFAAARLEVAQMDVFGQQLSEAVLGIDRSEREWLVQIDSAKISGAFFVPYQLNQQPIIANLERLYIETGDNGPSGESSDDNAAAAARSAAMDPRKVPQMDIQADDFRLGDMKLGQLRATLRSIPDGISLEQYSSTAASFRVEGRGGWHIDELRQSCDLELKLLSTDVEPTLVDLGMDSSVDAGEAEIDFALNWPGPPGPEFKKNLNGYVKVRVGAGQLQTVEPGAGRVFGLFSFTALPRRLSLDFRDVFDTGFGFDYITGDFTLDNGNAFTSNLVLEGPAAQVGIAGRAGLAERDYDQTAVVYGNFGAALPVAGVLAGGPVGGAAMLIFSELFKKPLQDMSRATYRITGSWDEPVIERVVASASTEGDS